MAVRWKRGFFRVWVVLSILWVLGFGAYILIGVPDAIRGSSYELIYRLKAGAKLKSWEAAPITPSEDHYDPLEEEEELAGGRMTTDQPGAARPNITLEQIDAELERRRLWPYVRPEPPAEGGYPLLEIEDPEFIIVKWRRLVELRESDKHLKHQAPDGSTLFLPNWATEKGRDHTIKIYDGWSATSKRWFEHATPPLVGAFAFPVATLVIGLIISWVLRGFRSAK